VIFFCPECQERLEQSGTVNGMYCDQCGQSYLLKIEFIKVDGNHRKFSGEGRAQLNSKNE
jgi:predicted amidophosphoribosyltransferase